MLIVDRGYYKCTRCKMKKDIETIDDAVINTVKEQIRDRLYESKRYDVVEKQGIISLRIYGLGSEVNWYTVVKNWVVGKVWVGDDITVEGMGVKELDELME